MTIQREGWSSKRARELHMEDEIGCGVVCLTCKPKRSRKEWKNSDHVMLARPTLTRRAAYELGQIHERQFSRDHRLVVTAYCQVWGGGKGLTEAEKRNGKVRARRRW